MPSVLVRIVQEHHPEEGLSHEAPRPVQKGQLMMSITKLLVSVAEASAMLGMSRSTLLKRTYSDDVPSVLIGRRRMYSTEALREWVAGLSKATKTEGGQS